jgi:hypothetical protein
LLDFYQGVASALVIGFIGAHELGFD